MRTFRLNKLVRDKIVAHNEARNASVDYKILKKTEYLRALKDKLLEEAAELDVSDKSSLLKELADLQEIIDTIVSAVGETKESLGAEQTKKSAANGAFKKGHFVKTVALQDSDPWVDYYLKNPKKHPEVKGD